MVIIEYVPFGDLLGYLRKSRGLDDTYYNHLDAKPQTNLTSQQLMKMAWQIADGMSYLSSRNVSLRPAWFFVPLCTKKLILACLVVVTIFPESLSRDGYILIGT